MELPSCHHENQELISPALLEGLGVDPGTLYADTGTILRVALEAKEAAGQGFVALPFCHTTEAAALGAHIKPADHTAGPRPGDYAYTALDQVPRGVDLAADPVIARLLEACRQLAGRGEQVVWQITGPISLLSCMMDLSVLFKTWRKDPDSVQALWEGIIPMLLDLVSAVGAAGASALSFADPAGNGNILGPKYTKLLCRDFTLPFLRQALARCGDHTTLVLCPITAAALSTQEALSPAPAGAGQLACGCIKSGGSFARRMMLQDPA